MNLLCFLFFFSSRRRHTRLQGDWSSDVCSSDLVHLVEALVAQSAGQTILWDIPDQNGAAVKCAKEHGFTAQRPLTRMYLGENSTPGDPQKQFALAGPELG